MRLRHGCSRFGVLVVLVAVGVLGFSANAFAESTTYTPGGGSEQQFVVPAGVTQVDVTAIGGAGEASANHVPGGSGAKVTATLTVTPEQTLYVDFGGGARSVGESGLKAGGGGDASDVRSEAGVLSSRLIVAGGGGGGGEAGLEPGGSASGEIGEAGGSGENAGGGGGGTQSAGGSAGTGEETISGQEGKLGQGGSGGVFLPAAGGGGGGGYYGGGGGAASGNGPYGGSGGAGSSYITPEASEGSFASGAGLEQKVELTYTGPLPACTAVNGVGHIAPKGKEGENLRVHLTTSGGTFTTTTANGAAQFTLRTLSSASCAATPGGFEFSGRGTATMGGRKNTGYEMVFSFTTEGARTYLNLEVTKDATVIYKVTHEPLTKGSKVKFALP